MKAQKIVVATDFSEASLLAVETAFNLAPSESVTFYLVHVLEMPAPGEFIAATPPLEEVHEEIRRRLEELIPRNLEEGVTVKTQIITGRPPRAIADLAEEKGADLIVVGTHGRSGLARLLLGSTAEGLLRHAPCQVLVVKPKAKPEASGS